MFGKNVVRQMPNPGEVPQNFRLWAEIKLVSQNTEVGKCGRLFSYKTDRCIRFHSLGPTLWYAKNNFYLQKRTASFSTEQWGFLFILVRSKEIDPKLIKARIIETSIILRMSEFRPAFAEVF